MGSDRQKLQISAEFHSQFRYFNSKIYSEKSAPGCCKFWIGARSPGLVQGRRDSDLEALKGFMRWSGSASSSITTPGKPSKP